MAITYFRCTNLDENASSYNLYLKGVAEDTLLKTIDVTGVETEVEFNLNEIDALTEPNSYELYAQAISADINEFEHSKPSETLVYIVGDSSDTGDDDTGEEDDNTGSEGGGGNEGDNTNQYYTFTIIPDPDTATVTLTSTGYTQDGNSITVLNESKVYWKVEAEGYVSQSGEWTVTENKEYPVTLTLDTSTFPPVNYTEIEPLIHESKAVYESDDETLEMITNNDTNVYEFNDLPAPIIPYKADEVGIFQILLSAPVNGEYYIKKDDSSGSDNDEYFFISDLYLSNQNIGDIEYYSIDSEGTNINSYFPRILITVPKEVTIRGAYGKEGV